jgi:hypothetical protein
VGCGKTIVAFLALLAAAGSGYQGAIMVGGCVGWVAGWDALPSLRAIQLAHCWAGLPASRPCRAPLAVLC